LIDVPSGAAVASAFAFWEAWSVPGERVRISGARGANDGSVATHSADADRVVPAYARDLLALQRAAGNAAVGRLMRQVGWPKTSQASPNHGKTSPAPGVDRYPLYDPKLGGSTERSLDDDIKKKVTGEESGNRAIVLVSTELKQESDVQVWLHFHGSLRAGYRLESRTVRDVDAEKDRSDAQLSKSITEKGDTQIVVIMPQGSYAATPDFGDAVTDPGAYVKRVLAILEKDTGIKIKSKGLVITGWSFGGNYIAELAEKEAKTGTHLLDSVVLYEGVNNFRKTELDPKDPEPDPNKKKKITHDYLASSNRIDAYLKLVARNLMADLAKLDGLNAAAATSYLAGSFRFLAYYGESGDYTISYDMLDQGIRLIFGEPVTLAEEKRQKLRLPPNGLQIATRVPDSVGLDAKVAKLPAVVRDELRAHYQVIKVKQGDATEHAKQLDDGAGTLHTLGHDNSVGSGALLDALRKTRSMRTPAASATP
jgi:dienelactone hydrolase